MKAAATILLGLMAGTVFAVACAFLLARPAQAGEPPRAARAYQRELTREARAVWGLEAPVAVFAAQVHQESAWNPRAMSPVGAQGLAQFMPGTARWISRIDPALAENAPHDPRWALRALVVYDRHLFDRASGHTECDRIWFALRGYNGGEGHLRKEARNAVDELDRHAVDAACGTASRSRKHCAENVGYPRRILLRHQPLYAAWGRTVCL